MMDLCKRWLIYGKINEKAPIGYDNDNPNCAMYDPEGKYGAPILGAINNGYNVKDLEVFWADMEGYASYLFNKSHAACYSYITLLTAYLKRYYPVEFFAAVFSVQKEEEKRAKYIKVAESMGIEIKIPDINKSNRDFVPVPEDNSILYGLGSIKGVGEAAIDELINNRDYTSLEDILSKVPKKALNKRVGIALIKSGALNSFNNNRMELINQFYDLRKDKDERLDSEIYDESVCMEYEIATLGKAITYKPWWEEVAVDEKVDIVANVTNVRELIDKNGNMMAFIKLESNGCKIDGVVFARTYCSHSDKFDLLIGPVTLQLKGKKDSKGQLIVSSVKTINM